MTAGRGYDFDTLADDLAAVLEALDLREVTLLKTPDNPDGIDPPGLREALKAPYGPPKKDTSSTRT